MEKKISRAIVNAIIGAIGWGLIAVIPCLLTGAFDVFVIGAIVAEFIAADAGIGYSIRIALYQSDLAKILGALFMIGIIISVYQGMLESLSERVKKSWMISEET